MMGNKYKENITFMIVILPIITIHSYFMVMIFNKQSKLKAFKISIFCLTQKLLIVAFSVLRFIARNMKTILI